MLVFPQPRGTKWGSYPRPGADFYVCGLYRCQKLYNYTVNDFGRAMAVIKQQWSGFRSLARLANESASYEYNATLFFSLVPGVTYFQMKVPSEKGHLKQLFCFASSLLRSPSLPNQSSLNHIDRLSFRSKVSPVLVFGPCNRQNGRYCAKKQNGRW